MRRSTVVLVLVVGLPALQPELCLGQAKVEGLVEELKIVAEEFLTPDQHSVVWSSGPIERRGSRFLRLRFDSIEDGADEAYYLRILSADEVCLQEIRKREFSEGSEYWSNVFHRDSVFVEVVAETKPRKLRFRIAELSFEWESATALSITGDDDREHLLEVTGSPTLTEKASSVAWFVFTKGGETLSCSGFLLDRRYLLTNRHCVRGVQCKNAVAIFDYRKEGEKIELGPHYRCKAFHYSKSHDAAIVELAGDPGLAGYRGLELSSRRAGNPGLHDLVIIQHPGGEPKQVSRKDCRVSSTKKKSDLFGHRCDTAEGSSGSPVLSSGSLRVVGLHRLGFSSDGRWSDENRAIHIAVLRDFIRRVTGAQTTG